LGDQILHIKRSGAWSKAANWFFVVLLNFDFAFGKKNNNRLTGGSFMNPSAVIGWHGRAKKQLTNLLPRKLELTCGFIDFAVCHLPLFC
jgi:hypothetical protein